MAPDKEARGLELPTTFDPLDLTHIADPYPMYRNLRRHHRAFWHEGMKSWVVSRYSDCESVLRNSREFARDWRRVGQQVDPQRISIQNVDPPEHGLLHRLFLAGLRAQDIDGLARKAAVEAHASAEARDAGHIEVMRGYATPFALAFMSEFLGVRRPAMAEFADVSEAVMRGMDGGLRPEAAAAGETARQALTELVDEWYRDSGALAGALGHVDRALSSEPYRDLDPQHVRNTSRVMFQGGYSTLVAAIGNMLYVLSTDHDVQGRMRGLGDAELGPAVDEILRFDGPVQGTTRAAMHDLDIADTHVKAGQNVLCLLASANRDEQRFEDPDELRLGRRDNRHMAFGWGPHACIAGVVARSALIETARVFLNHGAITPAGAPRRRDTATLRAFDSLPVNSGNRP